MEAMARQGVTIAFPQRESAPQPTAGVVALQRPVREDGWPMSAQLTARGAHQRDEPVSVVVLRVDPRRGGLRRRRGGIELDSAFIVPQWRNELAADDVLVPLPEGRVGLLMPSSGLDEAFAFVDRLRSRCGRAVTLTAAVAAVRTSESLTEASLRAERKLSRFTRSGASALAV
ncbi:hypothetical protein [Paraconexibacter sp.]|uniref:hypothetical protein n=1 Tax=Paraconexibacter sp. TaxID=2949640 RepID=UPI0035666866